MSLEWYSGELQATKSAGWNVIKAFPNLSFNEAQLKAKECQKNPWYAGCSYIYHPYSLTIEGEQ